MDYRGNPMHSDYLWKWSLYRDVVSVQRSESIAKDRALGTQPAAFIERWSLDSTANLEVTHWASLVPRP